ncbi:MAG TPA: anthranilate phosphoribosyltransferase, partial [Thermoplasmata archaeon]
MIRDAIAHVVDGKHLTKEQAGEVMAEMISGSATQSQIGSFLTA